MCRSAGDYIPGNSEVRCRWDTDRWVVLEEGTGGLNAVDDNLNLSRAASACDEEAGLGGEEGFSNCREN